MFLEVKNMNSYETGTLLNYALGVMLAIFAAFAFSWAKGGKRSARQRDRWEAIGYLTFGLASMAFAAAHPTVQVLVLALSGCSLAILKAERLTGSK